MTPRGLLHGFKSYDEWADLNRMPVLPEPRRMSARTVAKIIAAMAVLAGLYAVLANWLTVEIIAPTAAEVSAPGFDLEAKLAEVMP